MQFSNPVEAAHVGTSLPVKVFIPTAFFLVDELQNQIVDEALNPIYGIGLVEMEP